jgi:hypothetical protein
MQSPMRELLGQAKILFPEVIGTSPLGEAQVQAPTTPLYAPTPITGDVGTSLPGEAQGQTATIPTEAVPQNNGVVEKLPASPGRAPPYPIGVVGDPLLSTYWKNTAAFTTIQEKETQIKHYKRMNASPEVLELVQLESKPFGSVCEKIISELFGLGPRTSSQNDATLNGKKIEIKTARYWAGKDDCVWQHLEPDHDYDYALFVLLNFQGWKVWCIKKTDLMDLRGKIVTDQGKQGCWTKKSAILPYLTPILTLADLQAFVQ